MNCPNCNELMEREDYGWGTISNPIHALYWCEGCGLQAIWLKTVPKRYPHLRILFDPRIDNSLDLGEIHGSPLEEGGY